MLSRFSLPAVSAFLSDTLSENLKKPLQPAGLFASAILLFLNLLLIHILAIQKLPIAVDLLDRSAALSTTWQIALASVLVLVLAYLLVSMRSTIYGLMTGESWANSPILGRFFRCIQEKMLESLEEEISGLHNRQSEEYWLKRWERNTRFPEKENILPTALGNRLNATASRIWERYRIDTAALWSPMEKVIAEDENLNARIDNEKSTLDFLLYLAFVLMVVFFEHTLIRLWLAPTPVGLTSEFLSAMLWSLAVLVLAYLFYRAAVTKAVSWGQTVQMVFDLRREKLRQALGLREFESVQDERDVWQKESAWLVWDARADDIFAIEPKPRRDLSWICSDNVKVQLKQPTPITTERTPAGDEAAQEVRKTEYLNYVLIVSNADTQQGGNDQSYPTEGAYILISDRRVPAIDLQSIEILQKDCTSGHSPEIVPTGRADSKHDLLWRIKKLQPNGACALWYRLPWRDVYKAKTNRRKLVITKTTVKSGPKVNLITFEIKNEYQDSRKRDLILDMFDHRITENHTPLGKCDGKRLQPEESPKGAGWHRWTCGKLPKDQSVTLDIYIVKKKERR